MTPLAQQFRSRFNRRQAISSTEYIERNATKIRPNPGPNWKAIGTGDFNGDGRSDILWQNTNTGQASIWEMNGSSLIGGGRAGPDPGPTWRAIGAADFNGDGFSDMKFTVEAVPQAKFTAWVAQAHAEGAALDQAGYAALAKQSQAVPAKSYGSVTQGLFDRIVSQRSGG